MARRIPPAIPERMPSPKTVIRSAIPGVGPNELGKWRAATARKNNARTGASA